MMLWIAVGLLLCFLPSQVLVNGLLTADAKCLPGYDWVRFGFDS